MKKNPRKTEAERLNFNIEKDRIIQFVKRKGGPIKDIASWKKSFPDVEFVTEDLHGNTLDWSKYTPAEIAAYVVIMQDSNRAELTYGVSTNHLYEHIRMSDTERLFSCFLAHVFIDLAYSTQELPNEAVETLLYYALQAVNFDELLEDLSKYYDDEDLGFDDEESYLRKVNLAEVAIFRFKLTHARIV